MAQKIIKHYVKKLLNKKDDFYDVINGSPRRIRSS